MSRQQDEDEDAAELLAKRREQNVHLAISLADARERAIRAEAERDEARHELRVALGRLSKAEYARDEARARAVEWETEAIRAKAKAARS